MCDNNWIRCGLNGNTFYTVVDGLYTGADKIYKRPIAVRITADRHNKTLSLSDDVTIELTISLVDIEDKLREVLNYDN